MTASPNSLAFILEKLVNAGDWRPFRAGIDVCTLYGTPGITPAAALLRYQPGATLPAHQHVGFEHILVISGTQIDESGQYERGCLVVNPPESCHSVSSPKGCVVLAIWESPVRFVE